MRKFKCKKNIIYTEAVNLTEDLNNYFINFSESVCSWGTIYLQDKYKNKKLEAVDYSVFGYTIIFYYKRR